MNWRKKVKPFRGNVWIDHRKMKTSLAKPNAKASYVSPKTQGISLAAPQIQPKLWVGSAHDRYEQEADQMADYAIKSTATGTGTAGGEATIQRKCATCEKEEVLQRNVLPKAASAAMEAPDAVQRALHHSLGGESLPRSTLHQMEAVFGADFSQVRIHRDRRAAQLNQQLQAKAFTYDKDIYFHPSQYNPGTSAGDHLLAHELSHVVQQNTSSTMPPIQRQEIEIPSPEAEERSFEFDFEVLPPSLQFRLGNMMLQATHSATEFRVTHSLMQYSLGYNYGSDIFWGANTGSFSSRFGINPSNGDFSLGLTQDELRFGVSASPFSGAFGFNLGVGAPLLPMPSELGAPVYGGLAGVSGVLGGLSNVSDPFSFYQSQSDNIDAIMGAVNTLKPLADANNRRFGAGLRFSYTPSTGILAHAGMQWFF